MSQEKHLKDPKKESPKPHLLCFHLDLLACKQTEIAVTGYHLLLEISNYHLLRQRGGVGIIL